MDYFSLFGLSICYQIDIEKLVSRFQDLQRQYHPDRFANKSQEEQLFATQQSATINRARQILCNPLSRAEYILSLRGFNLANEQRIICDASFLMEQFSLREELDKIKCIKDRELLKAFIQKVKRMFDLLHQQMVVELNNESWENAVNSIRKLRFLNELHNSAERLKEKLFDL